MKPEKVISLEEEDVNRIASVVVLYNPCESVVSNISSYLTQASELFVFDNSDVPNPQIIDIMKSIPKTVYYTEKKNCGIGYALNYAARWAVNNGYEFLLTMDQDSVASDLMVEKLLNVFSLKDNVGISAAYPLNKFYPKNPPDNEIHNIDRVITSGNLIDLRVYHSVGPFLDDLFIDYVDFEYCFRLRKMNYKIMINNAAIFYHSVGVLKKWNIFGYKFYSTNHPPLRLYYRTRNRFYLRKIYGKQERDFFTLDMKNFFLEIIKIILVESKKIQKLRMIFRGLIDLKKINSVNFKETTEN